MSVAKPVREDRAHITTRRTISDEPLNYRNGSVLAQAHHGRGAVSICADRAIKCAVACVLMGSLRPSSQISMASLRRFELADLVET
jgi:hypothetical protein